jgi:formylglycine-generating enzyme required for sulfatase activity
MGCVAKARTVRVAAGEFVVGPNDWESEHVAFRRGRTETFWLDANEVTIERYLRCIAAGKCSMHLDERGAYEPGQPVTSIVVEEARAFCAYAHGRLPSTNEWLRVSTGAKSYRFPWGQTGLVCRRASYGLATGPCAEGGTEPELSGTRITGKSAEGLFDLVGNVAEIVVGDGGTIEIRGGSFRSDHAAVLKSWSVAPYQGARDDVGFRCAYDTEPVAFDEGT